MDNIVDYTTEVLHKYYEKDGCRYAFSIYPEYYEEEDGLAVTGKKFVIAITPQGTYSFEITLGKAGWVSGNAYYDNHNIMVEINAVLITGHSISSN